MTIKIVFLCTANRCRSPLAAAMFERTAAVRGATVRTLSAGLLRSGDPMPPDGIRVANEYGLDLRSHRSTQLTAGLIDDADLILGMGREHAREAVATVPGRWPRTFTFLQFARWLETAEPPRRATLGNWLDAVAADRPRSLLIGSDPVDDIADPIGRPRAFWRDTAALLQTLTEDMVGCLSPILR